MAGERWRRFEREIETKVREGSGLKYNSQRKVVGESGSMWKVDGVVFSGEEPVSYIEAKYIGSNSEAQTQYKLAYAELAEFRYSDIPGAVVVPQKRYPGNKNWDEYFASIGCVLIDKASLGDLLDTLQDFPTAPDTSDPLEDFIAEEVWENMGDESLRLAATDEPEPADEKVSELQAIASNIVEEKNRQTQPERD